MRRAISEWYNKPIDKIAYHMVKYQGREGYTNRDVLRLAHVKPCSKSHNALFRWACAGSDNMGQRLVEGKAVFNKADRNYGGFNAEDIPELLHVYEAAKKLNMSNKSDRTTLCNYITNYGLTHEMIPTAGKKYPEVWEALTQKMPMTALIRNLGNISKAGLLGLGSEYTKFICDKITDPRALQGGRVHPLSILLAARTYGQGRGLRGKGTWDTNAKVARALDDAFYAAFKTITPTGKRFYHSVDISGSMHWGAATTDGLLQLHEAAAVLMMAALHSEDEAVTTAFHTSTKPLRINTGMDLSQVVNIIQSAGSGGTDMSSPISYALTKKIEADVLVFYTDSETWCGRHPQQIFEMYKRQINPAAKAVVVAMTATRVAGLDTLSPDVLHVVGFDASVPRVISGFAAD
jgi:60 kDa SS-A/Ro ribonucleoprotein